jgi:hypothetical protein
MARAGPVRGPARGTMAPGTASPHAVEWSSLLLRWISWVCAGQEALIDVSDLAVTLARRLLETGPIHHCDAAPALPDQPGSLQRALCRPTDVSTWLRNRLRSLAAKIIQYGVLPRTDLT